MIGDYLHSINHHYRPHTAHPHPESALILPPAAKRVSHIHDKRQTFSCYTSHIGNSAIQFMHQGVKKTGWISHIMQIPLEGIVETFIFIHPHLPLPASEQAYSPYLKCPYMESAVVFERAKSVLIYHMGLKFK